MIVPLRRLEPKTPGLKGRHLNHSATTLFDCHIFTVIIKCRINRDICEHTCIYLYYLMSCLMKAFSDIEAAAFITSVTIALLIHNA